MAKTRRSWLLIFPALYIIFILTMFLGHAQGVDFFGHVSNQLSLRGTLQASPQGTPGFSQLDVQYEGLNFPFFGRSSVTVTDQTQNTRRLRVTGFNTLQNGFSVLFSEGFSIQFLTENGKEKELRIIPVIPETMQPISEINLPIKLDESARVEQSEDIGVLDISHSGGAYLLSLPSRAVLNADRGQLSLPGNVGRQTIRYVRSGDLPVATEKEVKDEPAEEAPAEVARPWFETEEVRVSEQQYQTSVQNFLNNAYSAWQGSRFDPASGTWIMGTDGNRGFSEAALVALLAEAWARDEYTEAFNLMRSAADLHQEEITIAGSLYLGNLQSIRATTQENDDIRSRELASAFARKDTQPLRDPSLIQWIIARGSRESYDSLEGYLSGLQLDLMEQQTLIGLLENAFPADTIPLAIRERLKTYWQPAIELLLEQSIRNGTKTFLGSNDNEATVANTVRAGVVFQKIGAETSNDQLTGIGRSMVRSALALADASGMLPGIVRFDDNGINARSGLVTPEELYPYIHSNTAYPTLTPLFNELGQGTYIYSIVPVQQVIGKPESFTLTLTNKPGRTHYLYIKGIQNYRVLNLFGFQWPPDPNFENYSRGTFYHRDSQTAMIKYFENTTNARIEYEF